MNLVLYNILNTVHSLKFVQYFHYRFSLNYTAHFKIIPLYLYQDFLYKIQEQGDKILVEAKSTSHFTQWVLLPSSLSFGNLPHVLRKMFSEIRSDFRFLIHVPGRTWVLKDPYLRSAPKGFRGNVFRTLRVQVGKTPSFVWSALPFPTLSKHMHFMFTFRLNQFFVLFPQIRNYVQWLPWLR